MTTSGVDGGVGHAVVDDAETAGRRAASRALEDIDAKPRIAYVFGSSFYDQESLLAGVNGIVSSPVVGCSTSGEIANEDHHTESVVVLALAGGGIEPGVGRGAGFEEHPRRAGMRAATNAVDALDEGSVSTAVTVPEEDRRRWYPSLSTNAFGPGLIGSKEWACVGIQDALGWAQISGGFAGDDWKGRQTWVYRDEEVVEDEMVVAALDVDAKVGTGAGSGIQATGHTFQVTEAEDNRLYELDGRPPLEIYRDLFDDPQINQNFLITNPLGKRKPGGGYAAEVLVDPDEEDGSVIFGEEPLEEGEPVALMKATPEAMLEGVDYAMERAMAAAGGPGDVAAVLVFDAATRWYHLSTAERNELEVVRDWVGPDVPIAGFYTNGGIGTANPLWEDDPSEARGNDIHYHGIVVQVISNEPLP